MSFALVTGCCGLVGSEASLFFSEQGLGIIGIDCHLRQQFFGDGGATTAMEEKLKKNIKRYQFHNADIRNLDQMEKIFRECGPSLEVIIHTAAQPSHDWAASDPFTDFDVNARGTLIMLDLFRKYAPQAVFIFASTNKVYGDKSNSLPFEEKEFRYEISASHAYYQQGIPESFSIDQSKHSLFGASKLSADTYVQEYGRYFNLKTVAFRCGCLTGPNHAGTIQHGFFSYLISTLCAGSSYKIIGYKGKQVRDNLHSLDLVQAFWQYYQNPKSPGSVYNMGGGRDSHCSILEAIQLIEKKLARKSQIVWDEVARAGDHIWWVSDASKFKRDFPQWKLRYTIPEIIEEMVDFNLSQSRSMKNAKPTQKVA
jgi:CDP-paratose 2-epimerase